jgi:hypothetical protein
MDFMMGMAKRDYDGEPYGGNNEGTKMIYLFLGVCVCVSAKTSLVLKTFLCWENSGTGSQVSRFSGF